MNTRLIIIAWVVMLAVLPFSGCLTTPSYEPPHINYCNYGSGTVLPEYFKYVNATCDKNYTCWVGYLSDAEAADFWHRGWEDCAGQDWFDYPPSPGTCLTVVDPEGLSAGKCYWWDYAFNNYNVSFFVHPEFNQCTAMIEKHMLGWPFNYTLWVEAEIIDSFNQNFECGWGATVENYNWCAERYYEIRGDD